MDVVDIILLYWGENDERHIRIYISVSIYIFSADTNKLLLLDIGYKSVKLKIRNLYELNIYIIL